MAATGPHPEGPRGSPPAALPVSSPGPGSAVGLGRGAPPGAGAGGAAGERGGGSARSGPPGAAARRLRADFVDAARPPLPAPSRRDRDAPGAPSSGGGPGGTKPQQAPWGVSGGDGEKPICGADGERENRGPGENERRGKKGRDVAEKQNQHGSCLFSIQVSSTALPALHFLHNSPSGGPEEFLFHCSQHLLGPGRGSLRCSSLLQSSIQKEARVASLPSKGGTSSAASAIWLARHARELSHES